MRFRLLASSIALAAIVSSYFQFGKPAIRSFVTAAERRVVELRAEPARDLLPPAEQLWFGMYRPELPWDFRRVTEVAGELGVEPKVASWYQTWGLGERSSFRRDAANAVLARGMVPLVTWEPWLSDFGSRSVEDADKSIDAILRGDYDDYIRAFARSVAAARKPVMLRPFHEPGNAWYAWSTVYNRPERVAEAFRHVVRLTRGEGARNAIFVWTPHTPADAAAWPGDEWVDWLGIDVFNYGEHSQPPRWSSFAQLVDWQLSIAVGRDKPVLVAEVGCSGDGGDRSEWWREMFRELAAKRWPRIRMVVVFDHPSFVSGGQTIDWGFTRQREIPPRLKGEALRARFASPR